MEASEAHKASLANVTPDEIARKHWVHGHPTLTRRALRRPFTQEITGSNPVGGIRLREWAELEDGFFVVLQAQVIARH